MQETNVKAEENVAEVKADVAEVEVKAPVPTAAKIIKDIDAILKETRVKLVVEIAEAGSPYTGVAQAIVVDIEYLKRVKEALK